MEAGGSLQRAFFKTVADDEDYPSKSDTPNVYYAQRLKSVGFPETVGNQPLGITEMEEDEFEYVFNLTEEYIREGKVILCFKADGMWFTIDKVLTCKTPCFKCVNYDAMPFRWELVVDGVNGLDDCWELNGTFALEKIGGCVWQTIGENSELCTVGVKWRLTGGCDLAYELPATSFNCGGSNTLVYAPPDTEADPPEDPP